MDTSNWMSTQAASCIVGDPAMGSGDWRDLLQRQRIVNKIMDTLKRHLPFTEYERLQQLNKIAERVEEEIYTAATSQPEYTRKICFMMLAMETRLQLPIRSNSAASYNSVNPSVSLDSSANGADWQEEVYQKIKIMKDLYLNGDWQEEVYQKIKAMKNLYLQDLNVMHQKLISKLQQHDSLQQTKNEQLEKLKIFKNMLERFMQFLQIPKHGILANYKDKLGTYEKQIINVINSNRRKPVPPQQQAQALPPQHMQSMQQSQQTHSQLTQVQSHENQMNLQGSMAPMQPNNMGNMQQNPSVSLSGVSNGQQNVMNSIQPSSNLDPGQNNSMNSLQQVSGGSLQQNTVSGAQQVNINPMSLQGNSNMLQHQHIKQQEQLLQNQQLKQFQQRQLQQQFLHKQQFMQQQQFLHKQQFMQQQQFQFHQQTKQQLPGNQLPQTGNPNGGDWQEEVYQKIKAMKDLYLLDLNDMHQKILSKLQQHDSLPQQPKNEQLEKLKVFKNMLERFMQFLQIPKHGILANYKDKLGTYEKQIISAINVNRRRPVPPQQQAQALPPQHMQAMQQSQQTHYVMDMQKSLCPQKRAMPEASSTQTSNLNGGDWQEEVYQKIKAMKDLYLLDLNDMHQKILSKLQQHGSLPQQPKNEQIEKLEAFKNMLERFMKFLQTPKHEILGNYKDKLGTYEKQIINVINSNR